MSTSRTETLTARDGGTSDATVVAPDEPSGHGILLFQEIFGVGEFLLAKAGDLARLGYTVLCPDVFWRVQPGVALDGDPDALQKGMAVAGRWSSEVADEDRVADLGVALDAVRGLAEVTGKVAAMGYCLGGTLAYRTAAHFEPDACVSYYGSGVADLLAAGESPSCPTIFHFGGSDDFIPSDQVEAIRAGLGSRDDVEVHVQDQAGHAFENFLSPQFSNPEAAAASWPLTTEFLGRTLGG